MPVFNTFFKIARKQIGSCAIYVVIFMVLCVMFSGMGDKSKSEYKLSSCDIAVFDRDNTEASKQLIEYLGMVHTIHTDYEDDSEVLQDSLYYRKLSYVLYIEEGFSKTGKLSNIKRQGTNVSAYIDGQISSYLSTKAAAVAAGYSEEEAYDIAVKALDQTGLVSFKGNVENKKGKGAYYFFLYIPYVLMMLMFTAVGPLLVAFNKKEARDRQSISSYPPGRRSFELLLAFVVLSVIIWFLFVILCLWVKGGRIAYEDIMCLLNALAFTMVSAGMVSIIGNFNISGGPFNMMCNIIGLAVAFLGGVFVPMEVFGEALRNVAKLIPTYWYVKANDAMFDGCDRSEFFTYIGMELLFAVAFFAVSMVVSKRVKETRTS